MPAFWDVAEAHALRRAASIDRIHQNLRQIEEGVMWIHLRAKGTGGIDVDLIVHDRSAGCVLNLPAAFVEFAHRKRLAGAILGAHPVHVLGEITNLVKGIPHGKLQFALSGTGWQDDLHFDEMLLGRRESDGVTDGSRRLRQ